MPGEERKFNRRRIVAFIPTSKCDREPAALHTSIVAGIAAMGVVIGSLTSVAVELGRGVGVSEDTTVRGSVFVHVAVDIEFVGSIDVMALKVACGDDTAERVVGAESIVPAKGDGAKVSDSDWGMAD